MIGKDTKELLTLAALFDAAAVFLVCIEETNDAAALGLGSVVWLFVAYYSHRKESYPRRVDQARPVSSLPSLPPERRNELVADLARIDQQIEQAKMVVAVADDRATELHAEMTLADLENKRYDVEAILKANG